MFSSSKNKIQHLLCSVILGVLTSFRSATPTLYCRVCCWIGCLTCEHTNFKLGWRQTYNLQFYPFSCWTYHFICDIKPWRHIRFIIQTPMPMPAIMWHRMIWAQWYVICRTLNMTLVFHENSLSEWYRIIYVFNNII